jgi:capsular polysaccharide biosynthesis protein
MKLAATIVSPEQVYRSLPLNLKAGDEALFRHELEKRIDSTKAIVTRNVTLLPNGFLSWGPRVLPESFSSVPTPRQAARHWLKFAAYNVTARKVRIVEKGLFATDEFSNGFFHWLCDVLPRLEAAFNDDNRQRTFLIPAMADFSYVADSLQPYGFSGLCISSWKERIRCADLLVVTQAAPTGNYRPSLMKALRKRFRTYFSAGEGNRRLFISRARAPRRRIANEDRVAEVMIGHGFERVNLEEFSFAEQVRLVGSAAVLAGNHGAGLANMLWMLPETTVLELRLRGDRLNNCYFSLASALNINYRYLECSSADEKAGVHWAEVLVDLDRLESELSAMDKDIKS